MNEQDEEVMATVLANEATARMFVDQLEARGVNLSKPKDTLTHQECVDVVLAVWSEISRRERNP